MKQHRARVLGAWCAAVGLIVTVAIFAVSRGPSDIDIPGVAATLSTPQDSQPIAILLDTNPDHRGTLRENGPLYDSLIDVGLGVVWVSTSERQIATDLTRTINGIGELPEYRTNRIGFVAEGAESSPLWHFITSPPAELRTAVFLNVPGLAGLDFADARSVAALSLNVESDQAATGSHHLVHEAMASVGVTHQVITYGDVRPLAFDDLSPDYDQTTADDAIERAAEWLLVRDGSRNTSPAGADQ